MSIGKDVKHGRGRGQKLRPFFVVAGVMAIVLVVSGMSMPVAFAATVNRNPPISCGRQQWGIDNDISNGLKSSFTFGHSDTTCLSVNGVWPSGTTTTNWVKLASKVTAPTDLAWKGIFQGNPLSPWGPGSEDYLCTGTNCYVTTPQFPTDPEQTTNWKLKRQWVWTNELLPVSANPDNSLHAYMLTDVVLKKQGAQTYIVIDFLNDALQDQSGQWQEYGISDQDSSAYLVQYYGTTCQDIGGKLVYSYNAILDNDSTNSPNVWRDDTDSIGVHFTQATGMFGSHYNLGSGCTVNDPGTISQYDIMSISSGVEVIQNDHDNNPSTEFSGSMRGGYSWTELFY